MLRVRRVEFQFVEPIPLIPRTSRRGTPPRGVGVHDPRRIWKRIRARTLTRLAINLFALLNVILFYCWIKRTSNLTVFRVCVTLLGSEKMCLALLKGRKEREREREMPRSSKSVSTGTTQRKRTKYDVIKVHHYGLTGEWRESI